MAKRVLTQSMAGRRRLLASTSTALAFSVASLAQAQSSAPFPTAKGTATTAPDQTTDSQPALSVSPSEVVVTGQAYSSAKTIVEKRELETISDGISSNQIGELPEFGLGDALASIPGVTFVINNGRGEDEFMTIRGLNPDYDSVTIDGMILPSTEETVRSLSFDVLPSVVINQADVLKTWTVDQPTDAVGGVTALRTRSAFDHPGFFFDSHLDAAYWDDPKEVHSNDPSGQADAVISKTFGPKDEFGVLGLVSYYSRSSSTLNTYTLPFSYYPNTAPAANVMALDQTSATASNTALKPSQDVNGDIAIPDRHRWYLYDNTRTRPGAFLRFDFDDHEHWHAHMTGGIFAFKNSEDRYSQYLNRVGDAIILTPDIGSYGSGAGEVDYDKYIQRRQVGYVDAGVGYDFTPKLKLAADFNYGRGTYHQNTAEDQFLQPTSAALAFSYNLSTETAPLLTPTGSAFYNPSLYLQQYHLNAVDQSHTDLPQGRIDLSYNESPGDNGLGFNAGFQARDLTQVYSYYQYRLNAPTVATPTLSQIGYINKSPSLYDGYGQSLLLVSDSDVNAYIAANPNLYVRNASDTLSNTINNYVLDESIISGYAQLAYRSDQFFSSVGVRYETTKDKVNNYLPEPFSSQTNFEAVETTQNYSKLLPALNIAYTPVKPLVIRAAVTQTLARPEYSQLAENSSASINASGTTATETIANPQLKPREATNYDLSIEYYPAAGTLASVAVFDKEIKNEIITLTSTLNGVSVPGDPTPAQVTITEPENGNRSRVKGVELNLVVSTFSFMPTEWLRGFGGRVNVAFMDYDAPYIRMSDGTFRHLPQLIASVREVANAALFYNWRRFSGEISYNHTGKQPISFDTHNEANDQWWAAIDTIDGQVRYQLTPGLDFRFQVKNITDARPQKVVGPTQNLNYSTLENGRAYFAGVAVHF